MILEHAYAITEHQFLWFLYTDYTICAVRVRAPTLWRVSYHVNTTTAWGRGKKHPSPLSPRGASGTQCLLGTLELGIDWI